MRLPSSAHTSRRWRIHEIAHDFRLEDVWALPTPGGPGDFPHMTAIAPFRHLIVYPPMLREIGRAWRDRPGEPASAPA